MTRFGWIVGWAALMLPGTLLPGAETDSGAAGPRATQTPRDIPISRITATASTTRPVGKACIPPNAIDGNPGTSWTSELRVLEEKGPQWLLLEMDGAYPVDALRYFKQSSPQEPGREYVNWIGRCEDYEIQVSLDGKGFSTVAAGTWNKEDLTEQRVEFTLSKARFVKLIGKKATWDTIVVSEVRLESPDPPEALSKPVAVKAKPAARTDAPHERRLDILEQNDIPPPPKATARDIPPSRMTATATSERFPTVWCAATSAVNGDPVTGWCSELGAIKSKGPQALTIELDEPCQVDAVRYYLAAQPGRPRYVAWIHRIQKVEIATSLDGKTFGTVASAEWDKDDLEVQRIVFEPVEAKYVRLTAFSADRDGAAASEVMLESPNPPRPKGIRVSPPADEKARREAFARRDSPEQLELLASRLARMARRGNPDLADLFLAREKRDATAAIAAFNRAFIKRLKRFDPVFKKDEPGVPHMSAPTEMMADVISGWPLASRFDVGKPGAINWDSSKIFSEISARGALALGPTVFDPLLDSYRAFGNEEHLLKWAEYMDDMLLFNQGYRNMTSFTMKDHDCGGPYRMRKLLVRLLQIEQTRPGSLQKLPVGLFARLLTKMVPERIALSAAYLHANAQNWTHHAAPTHLQIGSFLDGLIAMDVPMTERALRMLETYETRSNLPDGTEAEQAMWYNWGYVGSVLEFLHTVDTLERIEPGTLSLDATRRAELEDAILRRLRFCAQIYTQRGEWPLFLRGDNRQLWGLGSLRSDNNGVHAGAGNLPLGGYNERILNDPVIAPVLAAIGPDKGPPLAPRLPAAVSPSARLSLPATSNYFPWGGYRIIRENWDPSAQYGSMFCSPSPGKYWARGGSDHLNFGLSAFGHDLLIDDAKGHYAGFASPVMVDGTNQAYRLGYPTWGHKQVLLNGWEKPDDSRWLSSPALEFMEGTYRGPYGKWAGSLPEDIAKAVDNSIDGVTHQRQVIYLRNEGLWIVTDRLTSNQPHDYTWRWMLPCAPKQKEFFAFLPDEIRIEGGVEAGDEIRIEDSGWGIVTAKPDGPNLTMRTFCGPDLKTKTRRRGAPEYADTDDKAYYAHAKSKPWNHVMEINTTAADQQDILAVTAILPRATNDVDFKSIERVENETAEGFTAILPDGARVSYLAARADSAAMTAAGVTATAEALLVVQEEQGAGSEKQDGDVGIRGLVLGCTAMSVNEETVRVPGADVAFSIDNAHDKDEATSLATRLPGAVSPSARPSLLATPIRRPIERVKIEPAHDVFIGAETITLSCPTPDMEIRYTRNGTEPTRESTLYRKPFQVSATTTVKARAFRPGTTEQAGELDFTTASPVSLARFTKETPCPATRVAATQPGLKATYYEGEWQKLFVSTALVDPTGTGVVPCLMDISLRKNTGPFTFVYEGLLNVPADDVYTFHAPSEFMDNKIDNGYDLLLEIGGRRWVPSTRRHAFGNWSVALAAGAHKLRLKYSDYRGNRIEFRDPSWEDDVRFIDIDYTRKPPAPRNFPGMKGNYVWGGGVPELLVSAPGIQKQPVPKQWVRCMGDSESSSE